MSDLNSTLACLYYNLKCTGQRLHGTLIDAEDQSNSLKDEGFQIGQSDTNRLQLETGIDLGCIIEELKIKRQKGYLEVKLGHKAL